MKAMILAAGRGQRMEPLTQATPKPLLIAGYQVLIDYHLHALKAAGIQEVVINVCYHASQIINHVGDGKNYGLHVVFSDEQNGCLGTGGGIKKALPLLGKDPFLLLSADIFTYFSFEKLTKPAHSLAHLVLVDNPDFHPRGDFALDSEGFLKLNDENKMTFANIAIIDPELFSESPQEIFPLSLLFQKSIQQRRITGEYYGGFWDNIGTPNQLYSLNKMLRSNNKNLDPISIENKI